MQLIAQAIFVIRGQKVTLDCDLAALYGAEARALNHAVERNANPDPGDFMFRLSADEMGRVSQFVISQISRGEGKQNPNSSQFVMSSRKYCGKRYRSYTFTKQGTAMLSSMSNNTTVQIAGLLV